MFLKALALAMEAKLIRVGGPSLSIYISRIGCRLGELPLFGLTSFVRPNNGKTEILYL